MVGVQELIGVYVGELPGVNVKVGVGVEKLGV